MKRYLLTGIFIAALTALLTMSAGAISGNTVKVGLYYGGSALSAANLENAVGSGYSFGYYDSSRTFVPLGATADQRLTMSPSSGYRIQLAQSYADFSAAASAASAYPGAYPADISGSFCVRLGGYSTSSDAHTALQSLGVSGSVMTAGTTGTLVKNTATGDSLFEFDWQGLYNLGVQPEGRGEKTTTWCKGYRYYGGFEYARITGGNLNVMNVVNLEDYVKGVIPYEMSASWPTEALKAQAVCARTYVCRTTKHLKAYGFDVCASTDCQAYRGMGSSSANSDGAVDATAGMQLYSSGSLVDAVYFSSDGGATEDAKNVWGTAASYLIGKKDPYESTISIPNYAYSVTYTASQMTAILQRNGYSIGTVKNAYVSQFTDMGNAYKVTFVDTSGKTLTVTGSKCCSALYSSTYGKSIRSMRFKISGGTGESTDTGASDGYYVNGSGSKLNSLNGAYAISGTGTVSGFSESDPYVITSSGKSALSAASGSASTVSADSFVVTGTGYGHNVGMSQYGAYAMAKKGLSYTDILNFYYTNVTIG
jgi:stage II sporulation protein D